MQNTSYSKELKDISTKIETYFANPNRSKEKELAEQYELINVNTIINELLRLEPGLLAILNENRQILSVNKTLLSSLGVEQIDSVLGLRPGEALQCQYSSIMPAGCGTSRYCSSCGAAIAIVSALNDTNVSEKDCVISADRDGKPIEIYLSVKATPFKINDNTFVLLLLKDNTIDKQRAHLERVFLHDIIDLVSALNSTTGLIDQVDLDENPQLLDLLKNISKKINQEFEIQRNLIESEFFNLTTNFALTSLYNVINEIELLYTDHALCVGKNLVYIKPDHDIAFVSDNYLLIKSICNLLINALEASLPGETVNFSADYTDEFIKFKISNNYVIPKGIAGRIFNRNFTTKEGSGRGIGTYTTKLIVERYLLGTVSFVSNLEEFTIFEIKIPRNVGK